MNLPHQAAPIRYWLAEPLPRDVEQSLDRLAQTNDVAHVAVMPDVHLSGDVCVGVAVATQRLIYPAAVGSDIGCGMAAVQFAGSADLLAGEDAAARLLTGLYRQVPTLKHGRETAPSELPEDLQCRALSHPQLERLKLRDGRLQFGTLGRGNHFLEFQADPSNRLWLMVHSGSRAMGQAITAHHLAPSSGPRGSNKLAGWDADSPGGQAYLADLDWAIAYAARSRLAMVAAVAEIMEQLFQVAIVSESLIHAHHNHVRREMHFDRWYWVHRKGALFAGAHEAGIIPGSMGTPSYHVTGRGHAAALCSSSHGAGRALRRGEACRAISPRQLQRELHGVWFDHRQLSRLRDEAPSAYKDIHGVMRAQRELTRIDRELRPLLSYKGV